MITNNILVDILDIISIKTSLNSFISFTLCITSPVDLFLKNWYGRLNSLLIIIYCYAAKIRIICQTTKKFG